MHTYHTRIALMLSGEGSLAHKGISHRRIHLLCKLHEFFGSSGNGNSASHKNVGPLRFLDHLDSTVDIALLDGIHPGKHLLRLHRCVLGLRRRHILGDIHQNRAGTSFLCNVEGSADGIRQLGDILDDKAVFRDGHDHACNVHLLEGIPSQQVHRHVGRDGHHGNRIHLSGGDSRDEIGGSGTGGRQADAHLSGRSRIAVRRMGSPLLMGCKHMMDLVGMFI